MLKENEVYNLDCLKGLRLIDDKSVDLILTDPPFAVGYDKKSEKLEKLGKLGEKQVERDLTYQEFNLSYPRFLRFILN